MTLIIINYYRCTKYCCLMYFHIGICIILVRASYFGIGQLCGSSEVPTDPKTRGCLKPIPPHPATEPTHQDLSAVLKAK